ncbi:MAG: ATP-binding protein, partial [Rhodoferax sp.]
KRTLHLIDAQTELQAAKERAEEATRVKSEFLAIMSHEIRTPLNAIMGLGYMAMQCQVDDKARNYLRKADQATQKLQSIVNDVLDFSKLEANQLQLDITAFSLCERLQQIYDIQAPIASQKQLALRLEVASNCPQFVMADANRIGQVLLNLLGNAIKFTKAGEVALLVDADERDDTQASLHFRVRDTGIGMSAAQREHLFEPFVQADPSVTRLYGGTGLGLAICRRLVEGMGGEIWVESEPGRGSTFHFLLRLPTALALPTQASPEEVAVKPDFHELRVLIVEDNPLNMEVMRDMLQALGITVAEVGNGQEALDLLEQQDFDLVLMDCHMPVMDGYSATRAIRRKPQWADLPVVAVTADASADSRKTIRASGFSGLLIKPLHPQNFNLLISSYLQIAIKRKRRLQIERATQNFASAPMVFIAETPAVS